ncbi:helix-turn-helix domain-containing protein [Maritimibacter sp. DP1N21-5]|uniref:helix-turn-helix domain-containing protein n=1 Tax=Maritimibacter sp. DP1N21-5 TaxID=2836867 RepID=UPI001C47480A|nr:helix-turn-helix domain-containing protein [Maritimibacter sp. DP1N21-5]MBV7408189.1 hypothetical protein [Maritimibacter sp. DP1N21-5]
MADDGQNRTGGMVTAADVVAVVARRHGLSPAAILGPNRCRPLVLARQEAMYLLRHVLDWSYPRVGRFVRRDHTSVMHGVREVERRMYASGDYCAEISELFDGFEASRLLRFSRGPMVAGVFRSVRAGTGPEPP